MLRSLAVLILCYAFPSVSLAQAEGLPFVPVAQPLSADWDMPRTEYGHPDLQGNWLFGSRTPLERPEHLGLKQTYTESEARALEQQMHERNLRQDAPLEPGRAAPEKGARIGQEADDAFLAHYRSPELVPVNGEYRTSVIIDPPDGRLPARKEFADYTDKLWAAGLHETDGPEGQPLSGRCLMFGAAVPSMTPIMMNPNMRIVQNKDYVMIMTEMVNDARIIRLHSTHPESRANKWMGDSIGHWDGDTLVVHTTQFRPDQSSSRFGGIKFSEDLELIEYYTLVDDNSILYRFTASDPQAYTQPFTGERILTRNPVTEEIYEFACHEGNYSLSGILAGARRQETGTAPQ